MEIIVKGSVDFGPDLVANALFGIKASNWAGKTHKKQTWEVVNGRNVQVWADFRAYDSWAESILDHGEFLQKPRYKEVLGEDDYKKVAHALRAAGYATDPSYPGKLIELIEKHNLRQYDNLKGEVNVPKHLVIAGHGMKRNGVYDPGAVGNGYREADVVRDNLIPAMRKYDGGQIDYIADYNVYDRGNVGSFKNYASVTELHFNAASNRAATGTEICIYKGFRPDKEDLAIVDVLGKYFVKRRFGEFFKGVGGVLLRGDLKNCNICAKAGITYRLVETCFISNANDMRIFFANQDAIGKGLVEAITGKQSQAPQEPRSDPKMRPEVVKYFEDLYDTIHNPEPAEWGAEAWEKATDLNVVDGNRPNALLTRLEYAASELRRLKG